MISVGVFAGSLIGALLESAAFIRIVLVLLAVCAAVVAVQMWRLRAKMSGLAKGE